MPNQTTSQTNNASGAENINKELERVIQQINRVNNATEKANSTLKRYINSFNELNKQAKSLQSTTKNLSIKGLNTSSTKQQTQSSNQQVQAKKKELQAAKLVASQLSSTAGKTISLSTALSSSLNPAIGITISSIILLSKLTIDASKNTAEYSKSLRQMGIQLNKLESDSIHTANNINKLKNQVGNVLQDFGEILEPVLNLIVEATSSLLKLAGIDDTETKTKKYGAQADISTSAMQSGFSLNSANALAGGTYNQAIKLAEAYGEQASDVAKKLADAWLTGSEAAKEYGVVVNDQVLTGYMASKGVDIANVEITDAMKQYYRYQLMLEETSASSKSNMQDQIKQWTKLGFIIDKTKGKLFSFDEVIQLTAADATIPEVLGGDNKDSLIDDPEVGNNGNILNNKDSLDKVPSDLGNATDKLDSATDKLSNAANSLVSAENTNASTLSTAGNTMNNASNNILDAANSLDSAADNIVIAFNSIYNNIVMGAAILSSAINSSMSNAANLLNNVTNNGIEALTNATSYMNNSLMSTTQSGLLAISSATSSGLNSIGGATSNGIDNIIDATKYSISDVSNTGKSWVNQIQQVGQQILAKMASYAAKESVGGTIANALGLGQHWNIISNIANDVRNNVSNSKSKLGSTGGIIKGVGTGTAKGTMANASALITSPFDIITEGADLITSMRDKETGKYNFKNLPSAIGNMIWSSLKNPLKAIGSGASYGYNAAKNNTGSVLLGGLGGITGGITNATAYGLLETFGDLVNVGELTQDLTVGGYNKFTGSNIKSDTSLNTFSGNVNTLLNDLVNGSNNSGLWNWIKTPAFADGGIGTREVNNATLFEGNKKEAVIPLESQAGINYLSNAMKQAQEGQVTTSGDIQVYLTLSGVNIADNEEQWQRVGEKIAEVIEVQRQRRGDLNYGSSF